MELDPALILGPFLESVGQAQELVKYTLGLPLPQADRELILAFQQEISDKKSLVETLGPEFLQKSSQGLKDGMKRLEELQKEKDQVLQDLGNLKQRAAQAAQTAHQAAEGHAKKTSAAGSRSHGQPAGASQAAGTFRGWSFARVAAALQHAKTIRPPP